ncbi:unnamed protein product [Paramecium primaurelia]|uniref:Uncharacterized protein n=1 Tax=Paramecium primaurelia TaxID=5886 RepID=A0A8S1MGG5_PARPR|nr:unnamed protein product [Paramecium primaurelia]
MSDQKKIKKPNLSSVSLTEKPSIMKQQKSPKHYKMSFDPEKYVEREDYLKMEKKYNELVQRVQALFLEINNRYYDFNDINEKLNRKSNEFGYTRLDPYRLIDLIKEMLATYIKGIIQTEEEVQSYKLCNDDEQQDYIWLLHKSEMDMRKMIRENQQLKLLIQNLEIKISNNEKQIELLTTYTQKAMEEMKSEFTFAIDLLSERESSLNILKDEIKRQTELITSQKQQLISVQVLEHKMGHLAEKQNKEKQKIKQEYDHTVKQKEQYLKQSFQLDQRAKEKIIQELEQEVKQLQIEKNIIERDLAQKIEFSQKKIDNQNNQLAEKISQISNLQKKIIDIHHSNYLQDKANHQSTKHEP